MRSRTISAALAVVGLLGSLLVVVPATLGATAITRSISLSGTGNISTGSFTPSKSGFTVDREFPEEEGADEAGPDPYAGNISLSAGTVGRGSSTSSTPKAKSDPTFQLGFQGLNHYQERYSRGGNQFSVEPPDQALCVGNGYVLEAVNAVLNVFSSSNGHSALPNNTSTNIVAGFPRDVNHAVDLNSFYGYIPAINRSTGVQGPFVTDPTCVYDAASNRFYLVILTLEVDSAGNFTTVNHLDLAVSATGNPTGSWNIYRIDVTNDGSNIGGTNPGPYLGDYPHIGVDANGIYLTTNAYPWCCNGFAGAQIYALRKSQLAAGASTVTMVHISTAGMVPLSSDAGSTQPGFTVWPAQSAGANFDTNAGGTEWFLSSNAADEAQSPKNGAAGSRTSSNIISWELTNTSSLNSSSPALHLSTHVIPVNQYGVPPKSRQPGSGTAPGINAPQGHCINDTTTTLFTNQPGCWRLLFNPPAPAHNEVVSRPDSNDTRMQQVMYANGKLWGALDTAVTVGGQNRAGIAWYIVNPGSSTIANQGTLGAAGIDFSYPAIGATSAGRGVMAFTVMGSAYYPSAAYAPIDAIGGVSSWNIVPGGAGVAPTDGFTSYKSQVGNPPRTRWGDYGAAAVDGDAVWLASEYIGGACDYTAWGGPFFAGGTGDNLLGTCGGASHGPGTRSALANWSTYVSKFVP